MPRWKVRSNSCNCFAAKPSKQTTKRSVLNIQDNFCTIVQQRCITYQNKASSIVVSLMAADPQRMADKEGRRLRALRECLHRALKLALACPSWNVSRDCILFTVSDSPLSPTDHSCALCRNSQLASKPCRSTALWHCTTCISR